MPDTDTPLEELRRRAGDLDIPGRSKMTAEQLEAAITISERKRDEAEAAIERRVATSSDETAYPASRLRSTPALHGQDTVVLAAAFADAGVSDDDEVTLSEVEDMIRRSQQRPVQTEEA